MPRDATSADLHAGSCLLGHDHEQPAHPPITRAPVRGPRGGPVAAVAVDEDLVWVAPLPTACVGAARAPSPTALLHLSLELAQELAAAQGAALEAVLAEAELVDAAARIVAGYLDDLPDLPLVGEPFGGEEGSD